MCKGDKVVNTKVAVEAMRLVAPRVMRADMAMGDMVDMAMGGSPAPWKARPWRARDGRVYHSMAAL